MLNYHFTLLCFITSMVEVPVYLLWVKREQMVIERFKSRMQCHAGGINLELINQLVGVESVRNDV